VILRDRTLHCAGSSNYGVLGVRVPPKDRDWKSALPVEGLRDVTSVATGTYSACALAKGAGEDSQALWCWGNYAIHGSRDSADEYRPKKMVRYPDVTQVSVGSGEQCALDTGGKVHCWGKYRMPYDVLGLGTVVQIVGGDDFTCSRDADGIVACWGENRWGQLGDGTVETRDVGKPAKLSGKATALAAGAWDACAVVDGEAWCWGVGTSRLNDNPKPSSPALTPQKVAGVRGRTSVTVGSAHACGLRSDATVWCWGNNAEGQIGDGTMPDTLDSTPAQRTKEHAPSAVRTGEAGDLPATVMVRWLSALATLVVPLLATLLLAIFDERRSRAAWRTIALPALSVEQPAYRAQPIHAGYYQRAPALMRRAAMGAWLLVGLGGPILGVGLILSADCARSAVAQFDHHFISAVMNALVASLPLLGLLLMLAVVRACRAVMHLQPKAVTSVKRMAVVLLLLTALPTVLIVLAAVSALVDGRSPTVRWLLERVHLESLSLLVFPYGAAWLLLVVVQGVLMLLVARAENTRATATAPGSGTP